MRKPLKIIGITLASLVGLFVVTVIIITIFFPELPVYIQVKNECPHIDQITEDYPYYDTEVPDDFVSITEKGITLMIPSDMYKKEPDRESTFTRYVDKDEDADTTIVLTINESDFDILLENDDFTDENIKEYFKKVKQPIPATHDEFFKYIMTLSFDDFDIHSKSNAQIFYTFAQKKENYYQGFNGTYFFEIDGAKGEIIVTDSYKDGSTSYMVSLFSGKDYSIKHLIAVKAKDLETIKQVITSIKLAEG